MEKNNDAMQQLLANYGGDSNTHKPKTTPLHEAVYQSNTEEVQRLLASKETDPNFALTHNNATPLYIATDEGQH